MALELYELCGRDPEIRFSPNVWFSKMALAHKQLDYTAVPWRFTDKEAIAFSGQGAVPVLKDGDTSVHDSWKIALYLEEAYPDRPSLFGGPGGMATAPFVRNWSMRAVMTNIAPIAIPKVWELLDETDGAYFRETREKRFGKRLEDLCSDTSSRLDALRKALDPLRATLADQPFIGGQTPLYHDHIVFGPFIWARCVSDLALLEEEDPVHAWLDRMLDAYGGVARSAKTGRDAA